MRGSFIIDPTGQTPLSFRSWEALAAAHGAAMDSDTTITFATHGTRRPNEPFLEVVPRPPPLEEPPPTPTAHAPNRRERRAQTAQARRRGA
jgi:hypothetical protein